MIKNYITLLLLLGCITVQSQDLILDVQSGIIPESRQDASPIENELSLQRHDTEIIKPFSFVRQSTEETSTLFLTLKQDIRRQILKNRANYIQLAIPVDGTHELELEFYKKDILSPGFTIETSAGQIDNTFADRSVFYHGMVKSHQESWATMAVYENEITIFIHDKQGKYTLGKVKDSSEYVFYNEDSVVPNVERACGTTSDTNAPSINIPEADLRSASMMNCPVRVYIETDFETYTNFNPQTTAAITTYVTNVMNQVIAMYATISIPMELSQVFVWTTDDMYGNGNTDDFNVAGPILTAFSNAMTGGFNGTIAHLITIDPITMSGGILGIANLGAVCASNSNATGYSQIYSTFQTFPTYSPTVSLFGHELGHNMDSPHTQACVWNGNNTAIDDCVATEGGCAAVNNGQAPAYVGTLMSYCGTSTLSFDPQVATRMQAHYAAAQTNCLATCGTPTCTDGIQNGQETGVDCGGPCPACTCNEVNITCGTPYNGTTVGGASNNNSYSCQGWDESGPEVIHEIVTTATGDITITLSNLNQDLDAFLLDGTSCSSTTCILAVDVSGTATNQPAGTYYVVVDGYQGASSSYTLQVDCTSPAPTCSDGVQNQGETGIDCGGPCAPCGGGGCNEVDISCGIPYNGTTIGSPNNNNNNYNCTGWTNTAPEVIHRITTTATGDITITISNNTAGDLDAFLLDGNDCTTTNCIIAVDVSGTATNQPAGTYYVVVDGYLTAESPYTLQVDCQGGSSDACTNAPSASGTIVGGNYYVNASITTTGQVAAGTDVNLKSNTDINLNPGFEIFATGTFSAEIGTCTLFQPDGPVSARFSNETKVEADKSDKSKKK